MGRLPGIKKWGIMESPKVILAPDIVPGDLKTREKFFNIA
jgi:hypothetical protein